MLFFELNEIEEREPVPGFKVRFVHSEHMTIAHWTIEPDAALPDHSHPHEQVTTIIEGEFEMTINEETKVLTPGTVAVIPPNAAHSGKSLTPCRIFDVFYPVREDYR